MKQRPKRTPDSLLEDLKKANKFGVLWPAMAHLPVAIKKTAIPKSSVVTAKALEPSKKAATKKKNKKTVIGHPKSKRVIKPDQKMIVDRAWLKGFGSEKFYEAPKPEKGAFRIPDRPWV